MSHTPGPWEYQASGIYSAETEAIHDGQTCEQVGHPATECGPAVIVAISPEVLEDIKCGAWDDCTAPNPDDLALMAAAPDMLAALKAQHSAMDSLFAMLIVLTRDYTPDNVFFPSRSGRIWEAATNAVALIRRVEGTP